MVVRHIIFAGLFATATFANAGTVEASSATVLPAWSSPATGGATVAPASGFGTLMAGPGSWSSHTRRGDRASESTMLLSMGSSAAAPAAPAAITTPPAADAAPVFAQPVQTAAEVVAEIVAAPAPSEMPAIVVSDEVIAAAPVALAAIPEPATGMLMLAGLLGAGFMSRRRK
jgi:hypothetical protein